ncbi:1-hydroxycarotenoid 3,4-desaturase CrtD [Citreimonas sp.]|uniref:1-hydroxycarotenoid 3,4-desaturase CrtD n=1 Tax=Citreimonas sp. TaxID=3036715 RepID=UPI0035C8379D
MVSLPAQHSAFSRRGPVVVIGAGIGGLAAALRLTAAGRDVTVIEAADAPGGKIRQAPRAAGGVDAGPTVLTLRAVFDELFAAAGAELDDHVTLHRQEILARHWWPGSGPLDLFADAGRSEAAVRAFAGPRAADEFRAFNARAKTLFDGFRAPVIESAVPELSALVRTVAARPALLRAMAPGRSLDAVLRRDLTDPRLRQLFGRYATYVGGSPYRSPGLLALIWQAEAGGVWAVEGGMHALARAIAALIEARGGRIRLNAPVARILTDSDGVTGVALAGGAVVPAAHVIFNGDPRALPLGLLGSGIADVAPRTRDAPRSLSAQVWAFASAIDGPALTHHNVFFCADPRAEFAALERGETPDDTTLYLCAQDRGFGRPPPARERFEIILNAPPLTGGRPDPEEFERCHTRTFQTLRRFGLTFADSPDRAALTTPDQFDARFPGSAGSLYGQSPHGMTAALARPTARTTVPGLWLAGGGCHPGAGVPMAALSGRHAAEAILKDRTSTLPSPRTATPGGMSTRFRIAARAPFRSSGS